MTACPNDQARRRAAAEISLPLSQIPGAEAEAETPHSVGDKPRHGTGRLLAAACAASQRLMTLRRTDFWAIVASVVEPRVVLRLAPR